jgi:predicted TIM-barrel fold metal-dependent hydrolase
MTVIDMRLRPPTPEFKKQFEELIPIFGFGPHPHWVEKKVEDEVKEMEEAEVIGVALARDVPGTRLSNDHIKSIIEKYPNRFLPVGSVDPSPVNRRAAQDELERVAKVLKFKGIMIDTGYLDPPMLPDDPRLYPIYADCEDLGLFVGLQIGMFAGPTSEFSRAVHVERFCLDFPKLTVVLLHGGYPFIHDVLEAMVKCRNLWCSPDSYMGLPLADHYVQMINHPLFGTRMMHGSSWPYGPGWKAFLDFVKTLPITPDAAEGYFYKNAARLFGLES